MFNNLSNKRYKYIGNPFGFVMKDRSVIHPIVSCYDDFNVNQKEKLLLIKKVVFDKIGQCNIYCFGSQIKGNWREDSDYDILIVKKTTEEERRYILTYPFGFKIDFNFRTEDKYYTKIVKI